MTEQELQKQKDHEEDLLRLRGFRPVDDTFMRVLFRNITTGRIRSANYYWQK